MRSIRLFLSLALCAAVFLAAPLSAAHGAEEAAVSMPQVELTAYGVAEGSLVAGGRATLRFTFRNNSPAASAGELCAYFEVLDGSIHPAFGASSQMYVGTLSPGGEAEVDVAFNIPEQAEGDVFLPMRLEYRDAGGGTLSSYIVLYLPILEKNGFSIQILPPETVYADAPADITGIIGNESGRTMGVTMRLEGDVDGAPVEIPLGSLQTGEQRLLRERVRFSDSGEGKTISVSFTLEDADGNVYRMPARAYALTVLPQDGAPGEGRAQGALAALLARIPNGVVLTLCGAALAHLALLSFLRGKRGRAPGRHRGGSGPFTGA